MAKKKTVVTTPTKRPDTLPADFKLVEQFDVDAALKELAWCELRLSAIGDETKALAKALAEKQAPKLKLVIGETETTLKERIESLDKAIQEWTEKNLKPLLKDPEERTLKLQHGSLSYRKLQLAIAIQDGLNERIVLEKIEQLTVSGEGPGLMLKARQICSAMLIKSLKLLLGDLINVSVSLNYDGMVEAYKAGRLDDKTLKKLGLVAQADKERFSYKAN